MTRARVEPPEKTTPHARSAPPNTTLAKRPRLEPVAAGAAASRRPCASSSSIRRVLDVNLVLPRLVALLDVASVAHFLEVLAVDETWRDVLTIDTLWHELLTVRFAGKAPAVELFGDDDRGTGEDEEEEEEGEGEEGEGEEGGGGEGDGGNMLEDGDEDEEEEVEEEVEDGDRMVLVEVLQSDEETGNDDDAVVGDNVDVNDDENDGLYRRSRRAASGSTASVGEGTQGEMGCLRDSTEQVVPSTWAANVPSPTVLAVACPDLKEYLRSAEQWVQFNARVRIIRGDIGEITMVEGQALDGLAFPTAAFLRNPHSGAAAAVFRRAGKGLSDHVRSLDVRLDVGQVHVTPGFDTGVAKLIHVVGPSGFNPQCFRDLQRTYRSVLRYIQTEHLSCVAMASISTGNMGMPIDKSAWFALCSIQRYMRSTDWTATIAIVCFEADVYAAFVRNKAKLLAQFNADTVRATPPLWNQ